MVYECNIVNVRSILNDFRRYENGETNIMPMRSNTPEEQTANTIHKRHKSCATIEEKSDVYASITDEEIVFEYEIQKNKA